MRLFKHFKCQVFAGYGFNICQYHGGFTEFTVWPSYAYFNDRSHIDRLKSGVTHHAWETTLNVRFYQVPNVKFCKVLRLRPLFTL
jgi:hypothetical protein